MAPLGYITKSMKDRTLVVRKIINLTDENMWVYNTSGSLVKLRPEATHKRVPLQAPLRGAYYAVEEETAEELRGVKEIEEKLIIPIYIGEGRMHEKIYHFKLFSAEDFLNVELE